MGLIFIPFILMVILFVPFILYTYVRAGYKEVRLILLFYVLNKLSAGIPGPPDM